MSQWIRNKSCEICGRIEVGLVEMNVGKTKHYLCYPCMADFLSDINHFSGIKLIDMNCHKTPHGFAIVVPHGFDTRELMEKWKDYDITLKKDESLFLDMITNGE